MKREKEKKRKVRYDTVMMLRLTREMYERLEALMEDELKQRK